MDQIGNALNAQPRSRALLPAIAALIILGTSATSLAQSHLWAIDKDVCTSDGTRCVKGIIRENAPFPTRDACDKQARNLMRQYQTAHMRVVYVRCVPVS